MGEMTRRSFVGAATAAAVAAPIMGMAMGDANEALAYQEGDYPQVPIEEDIAAATGFVGTPKDIERLGGSTMPLEALNMYRKKYIDAQTDYTYSDGTVIPAVFVKVRALINTYGTGWGNEYKDAMFDDLMREMSEDDAQAFLEMPYGQEFRAYDFHAASGRPLEECAELCERLANVGYLFRRYTSGGIRYHQMGLVQGLGEIRSIMHLETEPNFNNNMTGPDFLSDQEFGGTYLLQTIPCNKDLVVESGVMPYDDVEEIINAADYFAVAPCACRYGAIYRGGVEGAPNRADFQTGEFEDYLSPLCDFRVETCLHMGDEARYHVSVGNAREITREEAMGLMRRSVDDGLILQRLFSKDAQTICSCQVGCCNYLMGLAALGAAADTCRPFDQMRSHYELEVDREACIKCGACAQRCPMNVIQMDEEDGPVIANETYGQLCMRCGQCAIVCPAGARTLVPRPAEELLPLPQNILDDHNLKAAYRFEHGMLPF